MREITRLTEGLKILDKYAVDIEFDRHGVTVMLGNDGPPEKFEKELEKLGWMFDDDCWCFSR